MTSRVTTKGKDPKGMVSLSYIGIEVRDTKVLFITTCRVCNRRATGLISSVHAITDNLETCRRENSKTKRKLDH